MKISQKNVALGFAAGLVLGVAVLTSFGQKTVKGKKNTTTKKSAATQSTAVRNYTLPRYSVQYDSSQKLLLVTDNAYSQLYLYNTNASGGSTLMSRIDLRQTGARQLRAVTKRSGGSPKGKAAPSKGKAAPTKAKKKPAPAKKNPKKKG